MQHKINVIGAGLAGCEATYQLIKRGYEVNLYEMRPRKSTNAHKTDLFSELVCSNSFRAISIENAVGLLKAEMRILDSLILRAADASKIEAGGALAVDREMFSKFITKELKENKLVNVINEEVKEVLDGPSIIATGPLTSEELSRDIKRFCGEEYLYFFDAVAPIILEESIDKSKVYLKSRYDKGEASYLNCPLTKDEYLNFYNELIKADVVEPKDYELKVFEGCMAIEDIAKRGINTLLYGPLKPVGLRHPITLIQPYAVVQLRKDNALGTIYNMVGFQTHLKFGEQKRIIRMIPGLENAEIVRYGVMHKNTFINSPMVLNKFYQTKKRNDLFFAGQITGVEGYLESAASGMVAGINMARLIEGRELIDFSRVTAIGALSNYVSTFNSNFQPMNVNHGIFEAVDVRMKKKDRKEFYAKRALEYIDKVKGDL